MSRDSTVSLRAGNRAVRHLSPLMLKTIAGVALLALWEIVVRTLAPAYVARPSGMRWYFLRHQGCAIPRGGGCDAVAVVQGLVVS